MWSDGFAARMLSCLNLYVIFSAHQDHGGVRLPMNGDSICNGADDNASTSVALLALARAWKQQPGRRFALIVWHGAENRGLLKLKYHAAHPVVPITLLAAVVNGDMIGRNNPDTASLVGWTSTICRSTNLRGLNI